MSLLLTSVASAHQDSSINDCAKMELIGNLQTAKICYDAFNASKAKVASARLARKVAQNDYEALIHDFLAKYRNAHNVQHPDFPTQPSDQNLHYLTARLWCDKGHPIAALEQISNQT